MSLKAKLMSGFACVALFSVLIGIGGYWAQRALENTFVPIAEANLPRVISLGEAKATALDSLRLLTQIGLPANSSDELNRLDKKLAAAIAANAEADAAYAEKMPLGAKPLHDRVRASWNEVLALMRANKAMAMSAKLEDKLGFSKAYEGDFKVARLAFYDNLKALLKYEVELAAANVATAKATARVARIVVVCLVLIGFLAAAAIGAAISRSLANNLRKVAGSLSAGADSIRASSERLAQSSTQLAAATKDQAGSLQETSASLEEVSSMVGAALSSSREAVDLSRKVSALAEAGTQSMAELGDSVNEIAKLNARVDNLAKRIEEIGETTELIDEIVFQTRLLSFNAAVEAERAGEHGRGFAVVAQEIGNLAQMSGKSATKIGAIVKNAIHDAREVAATSRGTIELGVALCKKVSAQLGEIEGASKAIFNGATQALGSAEEQNTGIRLINQSLAVISRSTQQNAGAASDCSGASASLTDEGEALERVVTRLSEIVAGARGREAGHPASPSAVIKIAQL
jgi:methyl-accepting chemotaxis protein